MRQTNNQDCSQNQISEASQTGECFADFFVNVTSNYKDNVAIHYRHLGTWCSMGYKELKDKVDSLVACLAKLQINPNAQVVIISESRIEWPIFLFAAWLRGAIVVPLDEKMSASELKSAITAIQPIMIAISPSAYSQHKQTLAGYDNFLMMDMHQTSDEILSLANMEPVKDVEYYKREKQNTVLIASTSTTSGERKGVILSWRNISHQVQALGSCFSVGPQNMFLSVLPLHHMLELSCGLLTVLSKGSQLCYLGSLLPDEILQTIMTKGVTHMVGVPILSEMLSRRMQQYEKDGQDISLPLNTLIIGGAQLNSDNVKFFARHNINLLQGYGLTEASPVVTLNMNPAIKPDSIGQPLPSVKIKFKNLDNGEKSGNKTGEILVKGPNVMAGYYNDQQLTQSTIQDGWLHTGDIGYQDDKGYIYITGRLKNIIVLPSGKNVSSEEIEACIESNPLVSEVFVTGVSLNHIHHKQQAEQICALVVTTNENGVDDKAITTAAKLKQEIINQCAQLSAYKRPQHVVICNQNLPRTATGKIKRQAASIIAKELITLQLSRDK